jgi:hypothetical protein
MQLVEGSVLSGSVSSLWAASSFGLLFIFLSLSLGAFFLSSLAGFNHHILPHVDPAAEVSHWLHSNKKDKSLFFLFTLVF